MSMPTTLATAVEYNNLIDNYSSFHNGSSSFIPNGYVIWLTNYQLIKLTEKEVVDIILNRLSLSNDYGIAIMSSMRNLKRRTKRLKLNLRRSGDALCALFAEEFITSRPVSKKRPIDTDGVDKSAEPPVKVLKDGCEDCRKLQGSNLNLNVKLRTSRRRVARLQKKITLRNFRNRDRDRATEQIRSLRASKRNLKKQNAKQVGEISALTAKLASLSVVDQNSSRSQVNCMKSNQLLKEKNRIIVELNHRMAEKDKVIDTLECEIVELKNPQKFIETKKDGKTFDTDIRKTVYNCLLNHIPIASIPSIVRYTLKQMTDIDLTSTPCRTTVTNMAFEIAVMSDLQLGEILRRSSNVTLAWDATSLDGDHINEFHVNTGEGKFVVQIDRLAGGTTDDYATHINESISDVIATYSKFHNLEPNDVRKEIISKFTSTITDRCAVNHAVKKRIEELLGIGLLELNCNVHPLDGLASTSRTTLAVIDKEWSIDSLVFGHQCKAGNLIYGLSKLRYKMGVGDPAGLKQFLKKEGIHSGTIRRYVGNRFHLIFHMAGITFYIRNIFIKFLQESSKNALKTALLPDLQNPKILVQLRVLGLFGKVLTGPWMRIFYSNKEHLAHLNSIQLVERALSALESYEESPLEILKATSDVFGNIIPEPNNPDPVLKSLMTQVNSDQQLISKIVIKLSAAYGVLLRRQFARYLPGGELYQPTEEMLSRTENAPLHNMFSERTLGLTDYLARRAPNARVGFLNGKVRGLLNNTLEWLDGHNSSTQSRIVQFSISRAVEVRKIANDRQDRVDFIIERRKSNLAQKKDSRVRKSLELKLKRLIAGEYTPDKFKEMFSDQDKDRIDLALTILEDINSLMYRSITHVWFDREFSQNDKYYGKVVEIKPPTKRKSSRLLISYWGGGESEEDSEDFDILIEQFIVDFIFRDLILL